MWLSVNNINRPFWSFTGRKTKVIFRFLLLLLLITHALLNAQNQVQNNAFQVGEELTYRMNYSSPLGDFNAGTATVQLENSTFKDKPVIHIIGIGETNSFFDMFYKVRDRFESKIHPETLLPYQFIRRTREADFVFDDDIEFDRINGTATSRRKTKTIPSDVHDILSGVYYLRTLSLEDFGADSLLFINFFLDDSLYHSVIRYEGKSILLTDWGYLPCLKISPMVVTGEVFSRKYPMSVWVTDDENHIPVFAESEIIIGTVRMELVDYQNLKNPFIKSLTKKEIRKITKEQ